MNSVLFLKNWRPKVLAAYIWPVLIRALHSSYIISGNNFVNWSRYFWAKNIPDIRPIDWNWEMGATLICHKLRAERDVPFSKEVLSSFKIVSSNLNGPIIQFPLLKHIRTKTYIRTAKSVLGSLHHDGRTFWLLAEYQCISTFTHICKWPWQLKLHDRWKKQP